MPDPTQAQPSYDFSAGHLSVRIDGRPEIPFQFAARPGRTLAAMATTMCIQAGILALLVYVSRIGLQVAGVLPEHPPTVVFLPSEGPGGGGGGGGNQMKEPPKKAEIPKPKAVTVAPVPAEPKPDLTPPVQFNIPVTTLASVEIPGAVEAPAGLPTLSQGSGSGGGGGTGRGTGVGPGTGSGLGPGSGGGTGGGVYRGGGSGVTDPVPTYQPRPGYTGEAMRARIQGDVWVECTVTTQGVCSDVHVVRSLDSKYGLDQEAVSTALKWRFRPGTFQGKPVDVIVVIAVEFTLR
jgi:TonB family protein